MFLSYANIGAGSDFAALRNTGVPVSQRIVGTLGGDATHLILFDNGSVSMPVPTIEAPRRVPVQLTEDAVPVTATHSGEPLPGRESFLPLKDESGKVPCKFCNFVKSPLGIALAVLTVGVAAAVYFRPRKG